jgi:hypothetical protein
MKGKSNMHGSKARVLLGLPFISRFSALPYGKLFMALVNFQIAISRHSNPIAFPNDVAV